MHSVAPLALPSTNVAASPPQKTSFKNEGVLAAAWRDYSQLFKLRVTAMILLTSWCAAYIAAERYVVGGLSWTVISALFAIALVAAGTAAMNEVIERETDAKMLRTANRPLVTGRISSSYACATALLMILGSVAFLALSTNLLTAYLTLLTSLLYLGAYTPLKKVTPMCTTVGAIPGAMPALLGWTAVRGRLDPEAFVLFAILFVWQFPHFHSIALIHRDDYARAGIRMLPVVKPNGDSTVYAILLTSAVLVPVSFLPAVMVASAVQYLTLAFLFGSGMFWFAYLLWRDHVLGEVEASRKRARQMLLATVAYLPALLTVLLVSLRP